MASAAANPEKIQGSIEKFAASWGATANAAPAASNQIKSSSSPPRPAAAAADGSTPSAAPDVPRASIPRPQQQTGVAKQSMLRPPAARKVSLTDQLLIRQQQQQPSTNNNAQHKADQSGMYQPVASLGAVNSSGLGEVPNSRQVGRQPATQRPRFEGNGAPVSAQNYNSSSNSRSKSLPPPPYHIATAGINRPQQQRAYRNSFPEEVPPVPPPRSPMPSKNSPLGNYLVKPMNAGNAGSTNGGGNGGNNGNPGGTIPGFKYNPSSQRNLPQQPRTLPQTPVQQQAAAAAAAAGKAIQTQTASSKTKNQHLQGHHHQRGFSNNLMSKAKNVYAVNSRPPPSSSVSTTRYGH